MMHPAIVMVLYALSVCAFVTGFVFIGFSPEGASLKGSVTMFALACFCGISACFWANAVSHDEIMKKLEGS